MFIRHSFTVIIALILLSHSAFGFEIKEILQSSQMPKRLSSYQFTVNCEGNAKISTDKLPPQIIQISQSGEMFVVDSKINNGDKSLSDPMIQHTIYAFNGSKYQCYIVGRDTISFSDTCCYPNLYFFPNPIILPYYWLITEKSNWSDLKNENIWRNRLDKAKYKGQTKIKEQICDIVEFPDNTEQYDHIYVYFSKELAYYPLRVKLTENNSESIIEVSEYTIKHTETGDIIFPLEITMNLIEEGQEQIQLNWKMLPETIQVNPIFDDDLFTISTSKVGTVVDYDALQKNNSSEISNEQVPISTKKWRYLIIGFINILFIGMIFIVLYKRRRAKELHENEI